MTESSGTENQESTVRIFLAKKGIPTPAKTSLFSSLSQLATVNELSYTDETSFERSIPVASSPLDVTSLILDEGCLQYLQSARAFVQDRHIVITALIEHWSDEIAGHLLRSSPDAIVTLNFADAAAYLQAQFSKENKEIPRLLELTLQEPRSPDTPTRGVGRTIDVLAGAADLSLKNLLMVRDAIISVSSNAQIQQNGTITDVRYCLHPDLLDSARPLLVAPVSSGPLSGATIQVEPVTDQTSPSSNTALCVVIGTDHESEKLALNYIRYNIPTLVREDSSAVTLFQRAASTSDYKRYIWEPDTAQYQNNLTEVMTDILSDTSSAQILATDLRFGLAEISSPQACAAAVLDLLAQLSRESSLHKRLAEKVASTPERSAYENLSSVLGTRTETFMDLGIKEYELGRHAADRGDWSDSFRHHSAALVCFNEVDSTFWKARTAGRLAWIETAQGHYASAYALLSDAANIDLMQGAANYLWAAQYAMRSHDIDTADKMLREFVRICRSRVFPFPSSKNLPEDNNTAFEVIILALRDFYKAVVEQAARGGFASVCLSDEGRLHVLEAVTAKDIETTESELGIAVVCFRTVGLTSYADFCEGRRQLLLACSSKPETASAYLDRAITTLRRIGQRFPGERDVLGILLSTASSHRSILRLVEQLRASGGIDAPGQLDSIVPALGNDSVAFGADYLSASARIFLLVRRAAENADGPSQDINLQLGSLFRRLYDSIPTTDAFYSPQFRELLLRAMRDA